MKAFFENQTMKSLMAAFDADLETLTNVLGFYVTRNAMFVMLLGSMFSIMLAAKILSREERERTAEFLLSKPVSRTEIVGSKLMAYLTSLVFLNIVVTGVGFLSLEIFKGESEYRLTAFLIYALYSFLLMLIFGAIGFFLSTLIKRGRSMSNIAIGIVLGSYFLVFISRITPAADIVGYISPFKFVPPGVLNMAYNLDGGRLAYFCGISCLLFLLSFLIYKKKDILV
jgi:ABC-2 type transport system permease protein